MELREGQLVHFGEENRNWVVLRKDGHWCIHRNLSLGQDPLQHSNYQICVPVTKDVEANMHVHGDVHAFPPAMLFTMLQ